MKITGAEIKFLKEVPLRARDDGDAILQGLAMTNRKFYCERMNKKFR